MFRACLGAGSRRIGARPVDMGCAVRFGTDRASGSTGLRGKSRFLVVRFFPGSVESPVRSLSLEIPAQSGKIKNGL